MIAIDLPPINFLPRLHEGRTSAAIVHVAGLRTVSLGLNAGTGLITAAFLGAQGRGEQAAMILAPQALAGFATLGLHASLIYNIKADARHEREYIAMDLVLTLSAGLLAAGICWFLMPLWLSKFSQHVVEEAQLFLLLTPVVTASQTFAAVLESRAEFGAANRAGCLQGISALVVLGALAATRHLTPATSAGAYAGATVLAFFYMAVMVDYRITEPIRLSGTLFARLLQYGLRFYGVDVITITSGYLDRIIIAAFLSPAALGAYVVAWGFSRLLNIVPSAAETVLFPTVAAKSTKTVIDTIAMTVRVLTVFNALGALCLGILGPYVIAAVLGKSFASASGPLIVLLISIIPASAVGLLYKGYAASGRPEIVSVIHGIGLAVSFAAMVLLVPLCGAIGAAYGILISALVRLGAALGGIPLLLGLPAPAILLSLNDVARIRERFAL